MKYYLSPYKSLLRKSADGEWEYFSHNFGGWRPDRAKGADAQTDGPYSLEEIIEIGFAVWDSWQYIETVDALI